jgi:hypothetical protein
MNSGQREAKVVCMAVRLLAYNQHRSWSLPFHSLSRIGDQMNREQATCDPKNVNVKSCRDAPIDSRMRLTAVNNGSRDPRVFDRQWFLR